MKTFLSSAENDNNMKKVIMKVGKKMNLLVSYYYLRTKSHTKIKHILDQLSKTSNSIMLDSGAFTFLNEYKTRTGMGTPTAGGKKIATEQTPDDYAKKYFEFLVRYERYFDHIAELDIDLIVGYKRVLAWREQLIKSVGVDKCIFVFHRTIPNCYLEWERWCQEYPTALLGIGGAAEGGVNMGKLFKTAIKYKARVHGFAMTKNAFVTKYPWYSVDSSSWNIGQRFGRVFYYNKANFKITSFHLNTVRTGSFETFRNVVFPKISQYMCVSFKALMEVRNNSVFLDICNIHAFLAQEKDLTRLWERRGIKFNS